MPPAGDGMIFSQEWQAHDDRMRKKKSKNSKVPAVDVEATLKRSSK